MEDTFITGIVAIVVCMLNNHFQQKRSREQHDKAITLIDYKLSELTKRVDMHNLVIERTYELEKKESVLKEQIKIANHRIEDLERKTENEL